MKKIYSIIIASLCASASLYAQSNTTFAFTYKGEVVPNGSIITIAETEMEDEGIYAMHCPVSVKNVSSSEAQLTLSCQGKENWEFENDEPYYFASVQFCPNGACRPWNEEALLSTTYATPTPAGEIADESDWIHVSVITDTPSFTYKGIVELTAQDENASHTPATITVIFDTEGISGIQSLNSIKLDGKCEVFNLCGKKIANSVNGLSKGVYIIKQAGVSRKVVIK